MTTITENFGRFLPGVNFTEIPGASLNVVGVLKRRAPLDTIEETLKDPTSVASVLFQKVGHSSFTIHCEDTPAQFVTDFMAPR